MTTEVLSGLYVSLTLLPDSLFKLEKAFRDLPEHIGKMHMQSQHCTVIYSKHEFPTDKALMLTNSRLSYNTMVEEYEIMVDHKGRNIIIARLRVTDRLQKLHNKWIDAGAKHGYPEYMAHITITSDFIDDKDLDVVKTYVRVLNGKEKPFIKLGKETSGQLT